MRSVFNTMPDLIIRQMDRQDLEAVHSIECASFITPWSYQALKGELKNKLAYYCVLELDEQVVGYAGMWLVFDEAHVTNVAVAPSKRRNGFGKMIMEHMIDTARAKGAEAMTLEVRQFNSAAQTLYFGMDFVQYGIRPGYYSDTREDALILWKRLI